MDANSAIPDGGLLATAPPFWDSYPQPVLTACDDAQSQRQLQAAQHQAEARFSAVVDGVQDYAIYLLDSTGHVTTWNLGAERIKGYTKEEVLGQHFSICFPPEQRAAGKPAMELAVAVAEGRFQIEDWRVRKNGQRYWGDELVVPLRDEAGELIGFTRFCRDLSERKAHEEERAALLAAEQAARQKAEAANQTKDRFLAMLSHELRTPLTPITFALHVLKKEARLTALGQKALGAIAENLAAEGQLIDDLLDASRIGHGKLELASTRMDLHGSVQRALDVCQGDFAVKKLRVVVSLTAADHVVQGDARRLEQVFWNVLKNAAKFTPEGGSIRVRSHNPAAGKVVVQVSDSGIGIEPEILPSIFAAFAQANAEVTRRFGGLGLGLTIAQAIVQAHTGQINVTSAGQGQGTTCSVELSTALKE